MKARHIIMILILVLFASIMISLKDEKGVLTLTCTVNNEFQGMDSVTSLDVEMKNNEIRDMEIVVDVTIPEEYQANKQNIINAMASSGKMSVTSTDKGFKGVMGVESDYFKSLNLSTKISYSELKESLEFQGYKCK